MLWSTLPLLMLALGAAWPPEAPAGAAVPAGVAADGPAPRRGKGSAPRHSKRQVEAVQPGSCRKLPPGQRIVKLNLKPGSDVADLVAWISSITCLQLVVPGSLTAADKKVTLFAPEPVTPEEAYRLFLDALDSIGLTVVRSGQFLQIMESSKAKSAPIPFYAGEHQPK
jgi:type II secretory pathway component GspD/PulD (secretin)